MQHGKFHLVSHCIKHELHLFNCYTSINNTSVISPLSVELIVISMFALKPHLKIDLNELSLTNSKSGKDLPKNRYYNPNLLMEQEREREREDAAIIRIIWKHKWLPISILPDFNISGLIE